VELGSCFNFDGEGVELAEGDQSGVGNLAIQKVIQEGINHESVKNTEVSNPLPVQGDAVG